MKSLTIAAAILMSFTIASCPPKGQQNKTPTREEYVQKVHKFIKKEAKKNDGYFPVYDSVQKKTLQLKLDKIHKDKLSHLGGDTYFDCANFKGKDGKLYDIDIFMKWNGRKFKKATKKMVHKVDGKPRYVWYEEDGIWKTKKPPKNPKKKMKDGHPAH